MKARPKTRELLLRKSEKFDAPNSGNDSLAKYSLQDKKNLYNPTLAKLSHPQSPFLMARACGIDYSRQVRMTSVEGDMIDSNESNCIHANSGQRPNYVNCALRLYGGHPHILICKKCSHRQALPSKEEVQLKSHRDDPQSTSHLTEDSINGTRPVVLSANEIQGAIQRADICKTCSANEGVILGTEGRSVYISQCKLQPAEPLSLLKDRCPEGKWPDRVDSTRSGLAVSPRRLLLRSYLSPGDIVMLTAAVRDLHRAHPYRFITAIQSSATELWEHNPLVEPFDATLGPWERIDVHYPLINQSNQRPVHFVRGYTEFLEEHLNVRIPVTEFRGDIYLSAAEMQWINQVHETFNYSGRFWIIMAGGKFDFTTKWWNPEYYQEVIDHFAGRIQFVQCGQKDHWHPPLSGVFDLIGRTSLRQFVRLMHHAEGVICPVTMAMHLAAAVPTRTGRLRPCVVVAGGREPPQWEAYPGHQFLHTIGCLPCCATGGCWKSRCQPVGDNDLKDTENRCERPVQVKNDLQIAQCMMMIKPQDVIGAIERYLAFR